MSNYTMLSKNCPECSDRFARSGFLPNITPISGRFWKFVRAFSARFAVRSTLRIYKNDVHPSASRAACQPIKSCAAHHSGQMLMLEGKTCSLRRAFTSWSYLSWSIMRSFSTRRHSTVWTETHVFRNRTSAISTGMRGGL